MKKLAYNSRFLLLLPLLLLPLVLSGEEVTKSFHKEYTAGNNTTLDINNKYGDVVVHSWNKDQVVIDVKVLVDMPNKDKAQRYLDMINVDFDQNGNTISAKTDIDEKFNFNWGFGSRKFRIDYTISMPVEAALTLVNKYGNSAIDELHGLANLDIKYGNLDAGKLTRDVKPYDQVYIAYGKGSIDEAGWLVLNLRYTGTMTLGKCKALLLDSRYSGLTVDESSSLVGDCKYDNLNIDKINNLVLEAGYTRVKVGTLSKKLDCTNSYGSLNVEKVPTGFESIKVNVRYMGADIGIDEGASYDLDAHVSYGGLQYNESEFKNTKRIIENTSQEISGIVGKETSPTASVNVNASYGTVKLF